MDWRCRESEGKAKIEGYMSVSDEEAHQRRCQMKVWKPCECRRLRMLAVWAPPSVPWWCSGGWLPNPGFQLPNRGVEAVRAALVGDRCQHQGVAVKLVVAIPGT